MTSPIGLAEVIELLRCPHCGGSFRLLARTICCDSGHSFDIAKQGYVNLLSRAAPSNADTAAMLAARQRFLGTGCYAPIIGQVASQLTGRNTLIEVGAGTGEYLRAALELNPAAAGVAIDVSAAACRRLARSHPRIGAVVADVWAGLPVATGSCDGLICAFAPRNPAEFKRVLRPGGLAVLVLPKPDHLRELRERHQLLAVGPAKLAQANQSFSEAGFRFVEAVDVRIKLQLADEQAQDLIAMGPNAFHQQAGAGAAITTQAQVTVALFEA